VGRSHNTHGRDEKCIQYCGWKPEGKRPLGRRRHRWGDNIKMDLGESVGSCGLDSSGSG